MGYSPFRWNIPLLKTLSSLHLPFANKLIFLDINIMSITGLTLTRSAALGYASKYLESLRSQNNGEPPVEDRNLIVRSLEKVQGLNTPFYYGDPILQATVGLKWDTFTSSLARNPGIELNGKNETGNSVAHTLIRFRPNETNHFLWKKKLNFDDTNDLGETPLHLAVTTGQPALADILIREKKVRIDIPDKTGHTATEKLDPYGYRLIHMLTLTGFGESVRELWKKGVDLGQTTSLGYKTIELKDDQGRTLAHHAALLGDLEFLKAVISQGADPRQLDKNDENVFTILEKRPDIRRQLRAWLKKHKPELLPPSGPSTTASQKKQTENTSTDKDKSTAVKAETTEKISPPQHITLPEIRITSDAEQQSKTQEPSPVEVDKADAHSEPINWFLPQKKNPQESQPKRTPPKTRLSNTKAALKRSEDRKAREFLPSKISAGKLRRKKNRQQKETESISGESYISTSDPDLALKLESQQHTNPLKASRRLGSKSMMDLRQFASEETKLPFPFNRLYSRELALEYMQLLNLDPETLTNPQATMDSIVAKADVEYRLNHSLKSRNNSKALKVNPDDEFWIIKNKPATDLLNKLGNRRYSKHSPTDEFLPGAKGHYARQYPSLIKPHKP